MTSTTKKQSFLICITIIEGKLFAIANMHSVVQVSIDRKKHTTNVRKGTDCPYYNEYFVFEFDTTLEDLLDKTINLTVIQPRSFMRSRAVLGHFNLDVSTLWQESDHQFYHKWAVLTAPNKDKNVELLGPRGYLKIDVVIQCEGQAPLIPILKQDSTDDIESNLLVPENVKYERSRAKFTFLIYNADVLTKSKGNKNDSNINSYVEITFAGIKGKTSVRKGTASPTWNEKIVITEYFPSLSQRFKIELKCTNASVPYIYCMYTKDISNDGEYGYLPCFGPSYIYLYGPGTTKDHEYKGRLLLEIRSEILTDLMWSSNNVETSPIRQPYISQWKMEPIFLFCSIFSVTMIDKMFGQQNVSFEMTIGFVTKNEEYSENTTKAIKCQPDNKRKYWNLPLNGTVLCLSHISVWPDQRNSVYNSNIIQCIYDKLETGLEKINDSLKIDETNTIIKKISETLIINCRTYLSVAKVAPKPIIELEQKQLQLCIKQIEDIEKNINDIIQISKKKQKLKKLKILCHKMYSLIDQVQMCWPDVFLWMLVDNVKIGLFRIPIKEVIFSKIPVRMGKYCGKLRTIFMKPAADLKFHSSKNASFVCKLVHQMWIGLESEKESCLNNIPEFYKPNLMSDKYKIPLEYICNEEHHFKCVVYMYQGSFLPGADSSGLSDPFVQIVVQNYCLITKTMHQTIQPVWDQTLICNDVIIYGTLNYIKDHVPEISLEVYDQDEHLCIKQEFEGGCNITPEVYFDSENVSIAKLQKYPIYNGDKKIGNLIVAAQLILKPESEILKTGVEENDVIPAEIKPEIKHFKMDVYFWGVHNSKTMGEIKRPKITVQFGDNKVTSSSIQDVFTFSNFSKPTQSILFEMSENEEYYPTLTIKMFTSKGFGYNSYIGINLSKVKDFMIQPLKNSERNTILTEPKNMGDKKSDTSTSDVTESYIEANINPSRSIDKIRNTIQVFIRTLSKTTTCLKNNKKLEQHRKDEYKNALKTCDWWTKFFISLKFSDDEISTKVAKELKLKVYNHALEDTKEFNHFNDLLNSFQIYRGKRSGDALLDEGNNVSTFKGAIKIYPWPQQEEIREQYVNEAGAPLSNGFFQHFPSNDQLAFVARVYIVRGLKLRPKDLNGKSDPYIIVRMNKQVIDDKEHYVANQVDPVFGRCFELKGMFPIDHKITIEVWDYDLTSRDDLIGETSIDIENRLYTFHRANCGIAKEYISTGPCAWRDQNKPSHILEVLCRRNNLPQPTYMENEIKIGPCIFKNDKPIHKENNIQKEILSLLALNNWKKVPVVGCTLVPEHVETRSLYHFSKPGLEQGKLQLWIDIFPQGDVPPPPPVDISPRLPIQYELRIIIWNTEDVILDEDDFFIGEKKSDIYVLGWLTDWKNYQYTDVHYNSLNGEGNFNWRFIFKFEYLEIEDKILVKSKEHIFSKDETEHKIPCRLNLQVWDNDTFSADDFLGALNLRLSRLPRGAKTSKRCNLKIFSSDAPTINLFKIKRHKGWWPFKGRCKETNEEIQTGKVEIEFDLLTEEDASKCPAGLGRSEPQGLPPPARPDISFFWLRSPLKSLKYLICKRFRKQVLCVIFLAIAGIVGMSFLKTLPNYLLQILTKIKGS